MRGNLSENYVLIPTVMDARQYEWEISPPTSFRVIKPMLAK